nr:reverse transcriptase domain-containing protein [Tanacetum cinerariifolium]
MADRTMEELLQAPTEGYREAIVIPKILAKNFEIKMNLLQLIQAKKFHGFKRDNPHTHISNFKRMTATLKYRDVPNDAIKFMLFPYSLVSAARIWYEKEPPNSVLTWDDLVNKFVNQFFPPSKTTHLKNEISRFTQRFEETFGEAWDRFKEMLRACPHHGFSELTQIDTFYNGLTEQDQNSLNVAAGGNLLNKTTREALKIIENKSKVRYSRSKSNVSRVNTNSRDNVSKTDDRIDKLADQISNLVEIVNKQVIAPAKAVEKTCVTCGGAHTYYDCIGTDSNQPSVCAETGSYNQVSLPNRASHQIPPPGFASVQNNLNRGNNFQNNQGYRSQMNNTPNFQNQGFQNQPFSVPNNQIQPSVPNEFSSYMKSNEIMIKRMQNQINVLRGDFNKQEENLRRNLNNDMRSILGSLFQNQPSTSGTLPSNTVPNPKGEMKGVTTRSGLAYEGPSIPTNSPLEKVDDQNTEEILDKEHSKCPGSSAQVEPLVVPISIPEPDVPMTQMKHTIPYPSRLNDQKLREKATNQMEKFFQNFHDFHFDISFADTLLLMPKFASTIKSLPANKDKLFELAKAPLNKNCPAMLLKKLPEKLGDPELTPTRMTLELADRSITYPKGVVEDVFVKVGKFNFPTDFVVVDFEADPRVSLILGRSFLRTGRALIDVYGEEITLSVNDESVTFNLNQTMRYSSTYDDNFVNRVDVTDIACEVFVQDFLDFQYNPKSSSPTLVSDASVSESDSYKEPIVKSSSPTLTSFGESELFLEEIKDFLNDDSTLILIENYVYDPEGDILFLEKLLNEDTFQLPPMDLKLAEENKAKSSVEEPPELELKELRSHLEYAFLEDSNKLPVIISNDLKDVEKEALINVLKSHKRAIAWKISDIKGIDLRFYTHMILIEDDYKPAVPSQRRVNPKIHDVIKKEVIKLLDADMIYPISYSPWVSPIHCVPKRGGMIIVANENNELIPVRLVTGWRVCIDYRKLNDATRKDHFSLPFMDQMLETLAGNEFYYFLDGFSGYFQILIDPQDQEKTIFTCPYGTFAYRFMPFGLCNAPSTFQRCMMSIFHDMIEKTIEVFMDDFSVFRDSFSSCLTNLDKMLNRCEETNLVLNWEKCNFMCREGIVLGHKILKSGIKVDRAKVDVIAKLPHPTTVKGVRSLLGHAGFYRRFIQDFSKIARPMTHLLEKETLFVFSKEFLGQRKSKHFQPIHYASKTMTEAQIHYTTTEKEMLAVIIRRCVHGQEAFEILKACHERPTRGHHGANLTAKKVFDVVFFWPSIYCDAHEMIKTCDTFDYLSKWVEAKALPTNDARVVVKFLKSLFSRFGIPRAIIIDRGTHFCNDQFTRVMIKYGTAGDHRKLHLNELSELRDLAYENYVIYKERTKKLHDFKIKNRIFNVGDQVLLFNSRLKIFSGKLKTRWSGPFTITRVYLYGTIELSQPNGPNFKVNGHRVKHYFGGNIPSNVAPDLHTFPMDN